MTSRTHPPPESAALGAEALAQGRLLVLGYGNAGRLDDGLGPAFCRALRDHLPPDLQEELEVRAAMQLNVEDASEVAGHDVVLFVDATLPGEEPFVFRAVAPGFRHAEFTTHSASPAGILGLAHSIFGASTRGYTLGIRGRDFGGFGEALSPTARENLGLALDFFSNLMGSRGASSPTPLPRGAKHV